MVAVAATPANLTREEGRWQKPEGRQAMALTEMRASRVRHDLHGRITALARDAHRLSRRELVEGVETIRSIANSYGFSTVSNLAGRLESALGRDAAPATVMTWLDAIDDAVTLEPMRSPAQAALLASVALRVGH